MNIRRGVRRAAVLTGMLGFAAGCAIVVLYGPRPYDLHDHGLTDFGILNGWDPDGWNYWLVAVGVLSLVPAAAAVLLTLILGWILRGFASSPEDESIIRKLFGPSRD
jgi:hypothetical protein